MKIRSVTGFYDPGAARAGYTLARLAALAQAAQATFGSAGYPVQTLRLATVPFPLMAPTCCDDSALNLVRTLEGEATRAGFDYLSLGPALPEEPQSYRLIPQMLAETQRCFFGGLMTRSGAVDLAAVRACGQVIAEAARLTADGFANLRFAALANVPAGGPFFPAAYHAARHPAGFALALEAADVALQAFDAASTLAEAQQNLLAALERATGELLPLAEALALRHKVNFAGFDISLAPFPGELTSLGAALERLGLPALGWAGSTAAAAFLASTLDRGNWRRVGFNGLMLPVLEDSTLAARAAEGVLTAKDLLLFSTVCGAGLDTLPLPGDSSSEQLSALLLDVAALACRLNKPLTARLMPVPGKQAGEQTSFVFDYFVNSRVMALPAQPLRALLAGDALLPLPPRPMN